MTSCDHCLKNTFFPIAGILEPTKGVCPDCYDEFFRESFDRDLKSNGEANALSNSELVAGVATLGEPAKRLVGNLINKDKKY